MTAMETEHLVDDYIRRLEEAAAGLPPPRRSELVAEIREHIDAAVIDAGVEDEVTVRNVLERLGPPDEIVEAAEPAAPWWQARGRRAGRPGRASGRLAGRGSCSCSRRKSGRIETRRSESAWR
jgi:hypothetical protein